MKVICNAFACCCLCLCVGCETSQDVNPGAMSECGVNCEAACCMKAKQCGPDCTKECCAGKVSPAAISDQVCPYSGAKSDSNLGAVSDKPACCSGK